MRHDQDRTKMITDNFFDGVYAPMTRMDPDYESSDDEVDGEAAAEKATQIVRPSAEREVIQSELPKELLDPTWEEFMYPDSIKVVHSDVRGQDAPRKKSLETDKTNKIDKPAPVKMTFRSNGNVLFTAGAVRAIGTDTLEEGEVTEAQKVGVPVKLRWIMHSQLQGFVLNVDRSAAGDKSSKVTVHFHVNNILATKDRDKLGLCFQHQKGLALTPTIDPKSDLNPKAQGASTLWGMTVSPWCLGDREDVFSGQNARPRFCGISPDDLSDILDKGSAALRDGRLNDHSILSHGDWILFGLLVCREFTMYRPWKANEAATEVYDYFTKYTMAVFVDILKHGNWPHYVRQAQNQGKNLDDDDFSLGNTLPSRHMVKTWRVKYDRFGKPEYADAETWGNFQTLTAYPDSSSKNVALRLGVERAEFQHNQSDRGGRGGGRGGDRGRGRDGSEARPDSSEPILPKAPTLTRAPHSVRFGQSIVDAVDALRAQGARRAKARREGRQR
jgi:hypothetical protein